MTTLWLIVWACNGFPAFTTSDSWFIALIVMGCIDLGGLLAKAKIFK